MAKRYQVEKVERLLIAGGFPKTYGHGMALYMHHLDQPDAAPTVEMSASAFKRATEQFDHDAICILDLAAGEGQATPVAQYVSRTLEQLQPLAEKRAADVLKKMKKKDWKSAMARCDFAFPGHGDFGVGDEGKFSCEAGAGEWVIGVASHAWRYGPDDLAMPGLPVVITARESSLVVFTFAVAPFWSKTPPTSRGFSRPPQVKTS